LLKKLFEPIKIGPTQLSNRVVMTAMHLNYTPGGAMTDQFINFYTARAKGGAGLIVIGGAEIDDQASGIDLMVSIKDDKFIPGLTRFTDAMHAAGAKVAVQLYMAGAYSFCGLRGLPTLAPSEFTSYFTKQQTTAMTLDDIDRVQGDFASAAIRAGQAGFDAVEVLGSAGYLICQFLSPKTNKRMDDYGGSLENRMRFGCETIRRVKQAVGDDLALIVRVAGNDFVPGSHTNQESRVFAKAAQDAGADCINVTGGWHESRVPQITMDLPKAGYAYLARGIKANVSVPVVACNRINDPLIAEEILSEGIADLIGMGRGFIADPEFVNKAKQGRINEIRRCVACNQKCFDYVFQLRGVGCMVNPRAGREAETEITPTESAKKILVIGAGPAGCSFAVTAAERGHKVTICEKEQQIGGQVHWFAPSTRKHDFPFLIDYFKAMLDKHGVEVRTGTEVTSELIAREKPDLVIVATGAAPFRPPIDAVDAPQVFQAWDVLKGRVQTGHDVVVVGGGSVGLETAVYLASKGTISPEQLYFLVMHNAESPEVLRDLCLQGTKKVTVIEMLPKIGQDIGMSTRWVLMKDIKMRGIDVVTSARMKDIQPDSIVYTDAKGEDHIIRADNVILAMGSRPENTLSKALEQAGCNVVVIGDANKVGKISSAIDEGFDLGRKV
jgi:2,4-dienoyl-CoA reductase (NADPH2)